MIQAFVSTYNVEYTIEPCLNHLLRVYPDVIVHDFGSNDSTIETVKRLNVPLVEHGLLKPKEYTLVKEELSSSVSKVFWSDGDEIWPFHCLINIRKKMDSYAIVNAWWRNLKVENGKVLLNEYTTKGAVAWDSSRFGIVRSWPRERLDSKIEEADRSKEQWEPIPEEVFCYHGIFLNITRKYDEARWNKRNKRLKVADRLGWEPVSSLPFDASAQLLNTPKGV